MTRHLAIAVATVLAFGTPAGAQIIGSYDNFDCVNDTGETAEGFEMDIEDIDAAGLTRAFPSNFSTQPFVNRFGIPTIAPYDNTPSGGHKGVKVTWAATWDGTKWVAKYGDYAPPNGGPAGNGVLFVAKPVLTQGDQCWLLGQGIGYATSGCEHFGVSYGSGVTPGVVRYHWLVPDKAQTGTLVQAVWKAGVGPIAPMPAVAYVPPAVAGQPPVIHAVAEAPEKPDPLDPQFGTAVWVKTYTSVGNAVPDLDALQANLVPKKPIKGRPVKVRWGLMQRPPAGVPNEALEKQEVEDDPVAPAKGNVALVKRYEYYAYTGVYDPETHEAICAPEGPKSNGPCTAGPKAYLYVDPVTAVSRRVVEKGKFLGAHNDAVNF